MRIDTKICSCTEEEGLATLVVRAGFLEGLTSLVDIALRECTGAELIQVVVELGIKVSRLLGEILVGAVHSVGDILLANGFHLFLRVGESGGYAIVVVVTARGQSRRDKESCRKSSAYLVNLLIVVYLLVT